MKRKVLSIAVATALATIAAGFGTAFAARPPGVGGGGGGDEGGGEVETAGNNLSYPAMQFGLGSSVPYSWAVGDGEFGKNYSYGCVGEEKVVVGSATYTYPNISCVSGWKEDGTAIAFLTKEQCTTDSDSSIPHPCLNQKVDRIYWQKTDGNVWSAQNAAVSSPVIIRWVDWGDSIESVTWGTSSILRVETQGYADLKQDPRTTEEFTVCGDGETATQCQTGLQQWHSQGQGTTEQWGIRTTETEEGSIGVPYLYGSPYAIVNAGTAELYLSKMESGSSACPTAYADRQFTGSGWTGACNLPVVPYTVELSVGGKFVHGYNWRMRDLPEAMPVSTYCPDVMAPATWNKAGWWRLTFVPNGGTAKMRFADSVAIVPPVTPSSAPAVVTTAAVTAEEGETDTGPLYQPVVSPYGSANLTYIDICIAAKTGGGGGGKGGGGGGGGPPTGGGGGGGPPTGGGGGGGPPTGGGGPRR